jgi:D-galactarolactone isomerase
MPAAESRASRAPRAPEGTVDTHIHIYGPPERYPVAPTSRVPVPPGGGSLENYRGLMDRLGIARCVVVQPSAYGADNRCTMAAVAALGDRARGVVVVAPDVSDGELERLTRAGAVGIRFFMLPGGVLPWEALPELAARVHEFGWHVQLQLDGREIEQHLSVLRGLPCDLVIDHTGKFLEPVGTDHPAFRALVSLVESGRVWVKLSAPYETSKEGPPDYMDVGVLARELIRARPDRMVWASNWPHPSAQPSPPDDLMLLETLLHWAEDDAVARRILVDNASRLYGFAAGGGAAPA